MEQKNNNEEVFVIVPTIKHTKWDNIKKPDDTMPEITLEDVKAWQILLGKPVRVSGIYVGSWWFKMCEDQLEAFFRKKKHHHRKVKLSKARKGRY